MGVWPIWRRDFTRFYRQPNRVGGALGAPLLLWLFIGSGFGDAFSPPADIEMGYLEYFFPGFIALVVLFTSIFSAMSIIEDRREGFLQSVLAAPVSRASVVTGKALSAASQALAQSLIALIPAFFFLDDFSAAKAAGVLAALAALSFGLSAFGLAMAWRMDSTQAYHSVMNLILMPMWLLSGAMFPLTTAPGWMSWLMRFNPLFYAVAALRSSFYGAKEAEALTGVSTAWAAGVAVAFGLVGFGAAVWAAQRPEA